MKKTILITIPDDLSPASEFVSEEMLSYLGEHFEVRRNTLGRNMSEDELQKALKGVDAVFCAWGSASYECIDTDSLKLIVYSAGSVADIVGKSVFDKGITVLSANRFFAESVAEGVLGYLISLFRYIPDEVEGIRQGKWRTAPAQFGIFDRKVGLIGLGAIARKLIEMLRPFRCEILVDPGYDASEEDLSSLGVKRATKEEIFSECDVISLHSALNETTENSIGKEHFELMKSGSVFINTARGKIIRENELIEVFERRQDIRAHLDVFQIEPLPADSPLRKLPNLYFSPHRGGPTADRRPKIGLLMAKEAVAFFNGDPVTTEVKKEAALRMTKERKLHG